VVERRCGGPAVERGTSVFATFLVGPEHERGGPDSMNPNPRTETKTRVSLKP